MAAVKEVARKPGFHLAATEEATPAVSPKAPSTVRRAEVMRTPETLVRSTAQVAA